NTGESYRFSDGRWIPRRFSGTWSLDVSHNRITWFDAGCGIEARSGIFPYRMRAWVEPARDAGPELGVRETLVLEYQPYDPAGAAGAAEHFYFARNAGWYEWERSGFHDMFNRLGGPARSPLRDVLCRCRALAAPQELPHLRQHRLRNRARHGARLADHVERDATGRGKRGKVEREVADAGVEELRHRLHHLAV